MARRNIQIRLLDAERSKRAANGGNREARTGGVELQCNVAAPVDNRLFFAGEACSPHFFSTAHGAYETGTAAAEEALASLSR